jgi:hypothetical protein
MAIRHWGWEREGLQDEEWLVEALTLSREFDDAWTEADATMNLGVVVWLKGDPTHG